MPVFVLADVHILDTTHKKNAYKFYIEKYIGTPYWINSRICLANTTFIPAIFICCYHCVEVGNPTEAVYFFWGKYRLMKRADTIAKIKPFCKLQFTDNACGNV